MPSIRDPPTALLCPISCELMDDPVMVVDSGHTYDRSHITHWCQMGGRLEPLTNLPFKSHPPRLVPNYALRSLVEEYKQARAATTGTTASRPPSPRSPCLSTAAGRHPLHPSCPPGPPTRPYQLVPTSRLHWWCPPHQQPHTAERRPQWSLWARGRLGRLRRRLPAVGRQLVRVGGCTLALLGLLLLIWLPASVCWLLQLLLRLLLKVLRSAARSWAAFHPRPGSCLSHSGSRRRKGAAAVLEEVEPGCYAARMCELLAARRVAGVRQLLEQRGREGVHVTREDCGRPLHWAVAADDGQVASELLDMGWCGVDTVDLLMDSSTPLHWAASEGRHQMAELLLLHRADMNAVDKHGNTALHKAAHGGHAFMAALLLDHGADVSTKNKEGNTPLHLAARYGHASVASVLVEHGADLAARNEDSRTPSRLAKLAGHKDLAARLHRAPRLLHFWGS